MRLCIHGTFPLLPALITLFGNERLLFAAVLSAVFHELGHIAAIKLCRGRAECVSLGITGVSIRYSLEKSSYKSDMLISLSGPFFGAMLSVGASALGHRLLSGAAAIQTLLNLLPASVMDGGRFLYALACSLKGPGFAEKLLLITSAVSSALLSAAGAFAFHAGKGSFTLLCIGAWIFAISASYCCKKNVWGV